jgi:3-phosphoshikimate 1-carboxyvinyltransferase
VYRSLAQPLDQLPDPLRIPPIPIRRGRAPFDITITPPGSKSLTNRALLLAALARGRSIVRRPLLEADDTERMLEALGRLGATVERAGAADLFVTGVDGRWRPAGSEIELNLSNAGTATRFLAAGAALSPVPIVIDGNARMRQRPIAELADALVRLGLKVEFLGQAGHPPLRLSPPGGAGLPRAALLELPTTLSSQFISALLLIAPWFPGGLTLKLTGAITSQSYISMTLGLLHRVGAATKYSDDMRVLRVSTPPASGDLGPSAAAAAPGLLAFDYTVEPDASGATYFWAAAALFVGSTCRVAGLDGESLQGDARFPELLHRMGAVLGKRDGEGAAISVRGCPQIAPILADMSAMPDAAMTLAAVACFAAGTSVIRGLRTLRVKECDRVQAMQVELTKLGIRVQNPVAGDRDAITVTPPPGGLNCAADCPEVVFDTYDDHRMAMSLALIGLRRPNVLIRNPGCVAKTYPTFWRDLTKLYE